MRTNRARLSFAAAAVVFAAGASTPLAAAPLDITQRPLFIATPVAPMNMLIMGRDHKLYYEAYNDASDLNNDGQLDVGYKPSVIEYYGYFDSYKCYTYDAGLGRFTPSSVTANKKCSASWSGDFLNYLTTPRIDALRKVLYGGKRSTDTNGTTVLERSFIQQDAHSWGKEYTSTAVNGFDIAEYAPLSQPTSGNRHLFANTTLTPQGNPILRVMSDNPYRVWNWLSIERPVAGDDCFNNSNARVNCRFTGSPFPGHPGTRAAFDTMEATYAVAANLYGSTTTRQTINCNSSNCNPFSGTEDEFLSIFSGQLVIPANRGGTFNFRVDGDDVIDFTLRSGSATGTIIASAGCYTTAGRGFGACGGAERTASVSLVSGTTYYFTFRHEEGTGGDGYQLFWTKTANTGGTGNANFTEVIVPASTGGNGGISSTGFNFATYDLTPQVSNGSVRTDYQARVEVCRTGMLESNCKLYPNGNYKPTGLVNDYGEVNDMYFGLITGSYRNNTEGGILRRAVTYFGGNDANSDGDYADAGDVAPEVDPSTGIHVTSVKGVVHTLNKLRVQGFNYGSYIHSFSGNNCPALGTRPLANGECRIWGNPIAEMMYESLRYFGGAAAATPRYATGGDATGVAEEGTGTVTYGTAGDIGYVGMDLPTATWNDPYAAFPVCTKPFQTVISDINPSYDGGLPGNAFSETAPDGSTPTAIAGFSAATESQTIWTQEFGGSRDVFIGQSGGLADSAPTAKSASSFGNIRGLAPEEPTKDGTYYAAAVARFGLQNDINAVASDQKLRTYSVALASPLPRIEFPVGGGTVTLVPFAKTVSGAFSTDPNAAFQPTNTIVDFYVEEIINLPGQPSDPLDNGGRGKAVFRINYEDVEQGNDHDMDAIVRYEVLENSNGSVTVNLTSEYAAGSANQHMGYVISGTTQDGIYLEVRDVGGGTTAYRLDTPAGVNPGGCGGASPAAACAAGLGLTASRTFTPGSSTSATLLKDPLWYAAKHGGYDDRDRNGVPAPGEFDVDNNGVPDSYFLVTNALGLRQQLDQAFRAIILANSPSGSTSANGTQINEGSLAFVPEFSTNNTDWFGDLTAYRLRPDGGTGVQVWKASERLPAAATRNILTTSSVSASGNTVDTFTVSGLGGSTVALARLGMSAADLALYDAVTPTAGDITIDDVVAYLRGDTGGELRNAGPFRNRTRPIGDILGSQPATFIANFGYVRLPASAGGGAAGYGAFLASKATRTPMIFVGANDGMLHGFRATAASNGGEEVFAYVPNAVLTNMHELLDPAYQHFYYVDATPTIGDAYDGSAWKTMLVGATGAGGRSVFALDVTNPAASFTASNVKWELTPDKGADFADIGYTTGQPSIALLNGNRWVAIFGNGHNSARYKGVLYVVDLFTGDLIKKFELPDGDIDDPNGLGPPAPVDTGEVLDLITDTIYAGDYHGRVWKFDVSAADPNSWSQTELFQAEDADGVRQIITGGIDVSKHHLGGQMVFFGTGRYFLSGDNVVPVDPQVNTFYGIWDGPNGTATRADLVEQVISAQTASGRAVSQNQVDWAAKKGWFLELIVSGEDAAGERFVSRPLVRFGRVFFNTFVPIGNQCQPGGINWQMILNALTGAADQTGLAASACGSGSGSGCGGITLGEGPPAGTPVLGTTQPTVPQCNPATDPGCVEDPYEPCEEGDTGCTDPDPSAIEPGDRCGFIVNIVPPGSPQIRIARPCGRQSWRQVQ